MNSHFGKVHPSWIFFSYSGSVTVHIEMVVLSVQGPCRAALQHLWVYAQSTHGDQRFGPSHEFITHSTRLLALKVNGESSKVKRYVLMMVWELVEMDEA